MPDASLTALAIPLVIAAISGASGYISAVFNARSGRRKDARDDFAIIIQERRAEITSLIQQLKDAEGKIRSLETDQKAMSAQLAVIESRAVQAPFPEWDVDRASRYVWCNVEFERLFLKPKGKDRQWAIGKSHADVWPEETARVLISMDGEASLRPSRTAMRDDVALPGDDALFRIVKFAALNSLTGAHIGFHGLAIPANF